MKRFEGSCYFCERLLWHPCQSISKNYATAMPSAAPAVLAPLVPTQQGVETSIRK